MNAPLTETPSSRIFELALAIDRRAECSALDFALGVGKLIIQGIFGGNISAWRMRGSRDLSFRQLSRLTQVSASVLYRSAAIYEMSCRMDVTQWGLPMSHLRAVIGLSADDQNRLLTTARREHWTVRRMEKACAAVRQQDRVRPVGRPPSPALLKGISRLNRAIEQTGQAPITLESLNPEQRQSALCRIDDQLRQLTTIRQRLAAITIPAVTIPAVTPTASRSPGTARGGRAARAAPRSHHR